MKPTKHIKKLAISLANKDEYPSVEYYTSTLCNLAEALSKGRYYTRVIKASKSGLSRKICFGYIKNNHLTVISNPHILKLAGCDKNGRIPGCGMDMLFQAQYNLFVTLLPSTRYQSGMKRYNEM